MNKSIAVAALLSVTEAALAHPGHGRPGWLHFHEFADGLVIVAALAVAGLIYWAWKK